MGGGAVSSAFQSLHLLGHRTLRATTFILSADGASRGSSLVATAFFLFLDFFERVCALACSAASSASSSSIATSARAARTAFACVRRERVRERSFDPLALRKFGVTAADVLPRASRNRLRHMEIDAVAQSN